MIPGLLLAAALGASPLRQETPAGQGAGPDVVHAPEEKDGVQHVRILPSALATVWLAAGYQWTANAPASSTGPASAFGLDLGGGLFFRVVGPVYFGALIDYALTGPNALLVAGGGGLVVDDVTVTGGFGYSSVGDGGVGALLGMDYALARGIALRLEGSWRHSSFTGSDLAEHRLTVWSLLAGLSLTL
jgi:hypothetical protein